MLLLLLLGLATFRATRVITVDEWPPTKALREWTIRRTGEDSAWSYLVECPWCVSVYVAAVVVAGAVLAGVSVPAPALMWLAASALTGLIARNLD